MESSEGEVAFQDHWSVSSGGSEKEHVEMYCNRADWGESVNDEECDAASAVCGVALCLSEVGLLEAPTDAKSNGIQDSEMVSRKPAASAESFSLNIVSFNARSLRGEPRMAELEMEAGAQGWDAILVQETWRREREEDDIRESGHRWLASSGAGRKHGVGILLHSRWRNTVDEFRPLSPRLASLALTVEGQKITLIVVYVPHAGHAQEEVEALYEEVTQEVTNAKKRFASVVVGGDFNAEIGAAQEGEDARFLGRPGSGERNQRRLDGKMGLGQQTCCC